MTGLPEALAVLEEIASDRWIELRVEGLLSSGREIDTWELWDKHDHWVGHSQGRRLARWNNPKILRRLRQQWLEVNPYHPVHLTHIG